MEGFLHIEPVNPLNIQCFQRQLVKYRYRISIHALAETASLQHTFNDVMHPDSNRDVSTSNPPSSGSHKLLQQKSLYLKLDHLQVQND